MTAYSTTAPLAHVIVVGAILIAGMYMAAEIANPILFAFVLVVIAAPVVSWLEEKGLPRKFAVPAVVGLIAALGLLLAGLISLSLLELQEGLPAYQEAIRQQLALLEPWFAEWGIDTAIPLPPQIGEGTAFVPPIGEILAELGTLVTAFLVLLLATIFMFGEFPGVGLRIRHALGSGAALAVAFEHFRCRLSGYAAVKIKTGLVTGAAVTVLLIALGVQAPLLWGLLIFLFSLIPFIGLPIASLPPVGVALLQYGLLGGLAVIAGIAIIDLLVRTYLFPAAIDRISDLPNAVIILSVFFWTFVLGVPGLFLAVPLTMFAKMGLEASTATQWMAVLLRPSDGA